MKMLLAHADKRPDPPSLYADQPIPADLDRIVLKCLEKEMGDRFASVDELSSDLAAVESECAWCPDEAAQWWCECGIETKHFHAGETQDSQEAATLIQPLEQAG